jgi:hypothetical protein
MNTSGLYHYNIYSKYLNDIYGYDEKTLNNTEKVEEILKDITQEWHLSEYYSILVENKIPTPYSEFVTIQNLFEHPEMIDAKITKFRNSQVFARTDSCSSKPSEPFYSAEDIIISLKSSDRTNSLILDPNCILVLREYITDISDYYEFRCFVHDGKCRGITSAQPINCDFKLTQTMLNNIISLINKIIFYTEYDMCTIDIAIHKYDINRDILTIEINTPVWLCATSGLFDLLNPYDYDILLGSYKPDIVKYPVLKIDYNDD